MITNNIPRQPACHPMAMMASGIPITLLLDLLDAAHLPSRNILHREQGNADWLDNHHPAMPRQMAGHAARGA